MPTLRSCHLLSPTSADILGTNAIDTLQLTIRNNPVKVHVDNIPTIRSHQHLQESCLQICKEFPDLWKLELGCLKDHSLEVKFKPDVTPDSASRAQYHSLCEKTSNQAYDVGIAKGIWKPVTFNEYGTLVVPIRKQSQSNQPSGAVYECVGTTPCLSLASWDAAPAYAITRRPDEKIGWHTSHLISGPRWCLQPDRARASEPETFRAEHTQRGPFSDAASIWHQFRYPVLPRCHGSAHKWPSRCGMVWHGMVWYGMVW